ncbi:MAG TPA: response regulator [Pyrinomonadaceae bacterium]|nr:response regulator [Pyrinomonadaceae bacterium]
MNQIGRTPSANDDSASGGRLPTILLVEDTEDNRQMMKKLLEMSGYLVLEATNGEEAVQVTSAESPELILMDLSLPVIDGLAATRLIRNLPNGNHLPIIAVSAHDTADFHADALAAGCDAYITKPINYPELEEIVESLMAKPKTRSE